METMTLGALAVQFRRNNQEIDHLVQMAGVTPVENEYGIFHVNLQDAAAIADQERIAHKAELARFREISATWPDND